MSLNPRRRPREVVIDALSELADICRGSEAQGCLCVIVEDPEQRSNICSRRRQVTADTVQDQQRVVAVSASRDVVHSHYASRAIITGLCPSGGAVQAE